MTRIILSTTIVLMAFTAASALEQGKYPVKGKHPGASVTPLQACRILKQDPTHTFLVDVRTRFEYQDVGHPTEAVVAVGFNADRIYNIRGGFEGDPVMNPDSPFYGKRNIGEWRLEGLPWTYKMNRKYMYQPGLN